MAIDIQTASVRVSRRTEVAKRVLDVAASVILALVVLPIVLIALAGAAISLRASPFFSQERTGLHGERFSFLKVRTLHPQVPDYIDKRQLDHSSIPPFCRLLRRLHLDELPQLLLVVQGKMSLVGPRPEMDYLHRRMPAQFAQLRTSVRPGCTGLWQVSVASAELINDSPQYDRFYLANRSVRLDLWVLYRTALKMLGVGRCITLDDVPRWVVPRRHVATDHDGLHGEAQLTLPAAVGR